MKAYFFEDKRTGKKRNTAIFANSAKEAKEKLKRPSPKYAKVYAVRQAKPGEGKNGQWSRLGPDGKTIKSHGRGFGPKTK
jgi:hypothetical protein